MQLTLTERFINYKLSKTVASILIGRTRFRDAPQQGRYQKEDVARINKRLNELFLELKSGIPEQKSAGGRRNVAAGAWSLALYRAILAENSDRVYATELTGDVLWAEFEKSIQLYLTIARFMTRDPQKRMNIGMKLSLRYPFSRPDYEFEFQPGVDKMTVNFKRCPVHDYIKTQGPDSLEFFRNTWCKLDFAMGEHMGGKYERPHTLSHGDSICDMTFTASPEKSARAAG